MNLKEAKPKLKSITQFFTDPIDILLLDVFNELDQHAGITVREQFTYCEPGSEKINIIELRINKDVEGNGNIKILVKFQVYTQQPDHSRTHAQFLDTTFDIVKGLINQYIQNIYYQEATSVKLNMKFNDQPKVTAYEDNNECDSSQKTFHASQIKGIFLDYSTHSVPKNCRLVRFNGGYFTVIEDPNGRPLAEYQEEIGKIARLQKLITGVEAECQQDRKILLQKLSGRNSPDNYVLWQQKNGLNPGETDTPIALPVCLYSDNNDIKGTVSRFMTANCMFGSEYLVGIGSDGRSYHLMDKKTCIPQGAKIIGVFANPNDHVYEQEAWRSHQWIANFISRSGSEKEKSNTVRVNHAVPELEYYLYAIAYLVRDEITIEGFEQYIASIKNRAASHRQKLKNIYKQYNIEITFDTPFIGLNLKDKNPQEMIDEIVCLLDGDANDTLNSIRQKGKVSFKILVEAMEKRYQESDTASIYSKGLGNFITSDIKSEKYKKPLEAKIEQYLKKINPWHSEKSINTVGSLSDALIFLERFSEVVRINRLFIENLRENVCVILHQDQIGLISEVKSRFKEAHKEMLSLVYQYPTTTRTFDTHISEKDCQSLFYAHGCSNANLTQSQKIDHRKLQTNQTIDYLQQVSNIHDVILKNFRLSKDKKLTDNEIMLRIISDYNTLFASKNCAKFFQNFSNALGKNAIEEALFFTRNFHHQITQVISDNDIATFAMLLASRFRTFTRKEKPCRFEDKEFDYIDDWRLIQTKSGCRYPLVDFVRHTCPVDIPGRWDSAAIKIHLISEYMRKLSKYLGPRIYSQVNGKILPDHTAANVCLFATETLGVYGNGRYINEQKKAAYLTKLLAQIQFGAPMYRAPTYLKNDHQLIALPESKKAASAFTRKMRKSVHYSMKKTLDHAGIESDETHLWGLFRVLCRLAHAYVKFQSGQMLSKESKPFEYQETPSFVNKRHVNMNMFECVPARHENAWINDGIAPAFSAEQRQSIFRFLPLFFGTVNNGGQFSFHSFRSNIMATFLLMNVFKETFMTKKHDYFDDKYTEHLFGNKNIGAEKWNYLNNAAVIDEFRFFVTLCFKLNIFTKGFYPWQNLIIHKMNLRNTGQALKASTNANEVEELARCLISMMCEHHYFDGRIAVNNLVSILPSMLTPKQSIRLISHWRNWMNVNTNIVNINAYDITEIDAPFWQKKNKPQSKVELSNCEFIRVRSNNGKQQKSAYKNGSLPTIIEEFTYVDLESGEQCPAVLTATEHWTIDFAFEIKRANEILELRVKTSHSIFQHSKYISCNKLMSSVQKVVVTAGNELVLQGSAIGDIYLIKANYAVRKCDNTHDMFVRSSDSVTTQICYFQDKKWRHSIPRENDIATITNRFFNKRNYSANHTIRHHAHLGVQNDGKEVIVKPGEAVIGIGVTGRNHAYFYSNWVDYDGNIGFSKIDLAQNKDEPNLYNIIGRVVYAENASVSAIEEAMSFLISGKDVSKQANNTFAHNVIAVCANPDDDKPMTIKNFMQQIRWPHKVSLDEHDKILAQAKKDIQIPDIPFSKTGKKDLSIRAWDFIRKNFNYEPSPSVFNCLRYVRELIKSCENDTVIQNLEAIFGVVNAMAHVPNRIPRLTFFVPFQSAEEDRNQRENIRRAEEAIIESNNSNRKLFEFLKKATDDDSPMLPLKRRTTARK